MTIKVKEYISNDNIIDYGSGYTAGSIKATEDFRKDKKEKNPGGNDTEYKRGYLDGYKFTYKKCESRVKAIEDDLTKMLKKCLIG